MKYRDYRGTAFANLGIIGVNFICFGYLEIAGDTRDIGFMISHGAMFPPLVLQGEYWRLLTAVFLHFGIEHIINNMLVLYVIGEHLERALGPLKYIVLYLVCGAGANLVSLLAGMARGTMAVSAGASGAVFGVVGGLFYAVLANRGRLGNLSVRQLAVMILLSLYLGFVSGGVDNTDHIAGLALGVVTGAVLYRRPRRQENDQV